MVATADPILRTRVPGRGAVGGTSTSHCIGIQLSCTSSSVTTSLLPADRIADGHLAYYDTSAFWYVSSAKITEMAVMITKEIM